MSEARKGIARVLAALGRSVAELEGGPEKAGGDVRGAARASTSPSTIGRPARSRGKGARAGSRGPEKVGDVLARVLRRRGLDRQLASQKVLEDWPRVVGPGLARVTRARSVRNGILVVEVPSSAWAMELNMRRRHIMARLNAGRSPRLRRVMFVLSDDDALGRGPGAAP